MSTLFYPFRLSQTSPRLVLSVPGEVPRLTKVLFAPAIISLVFAWYTGWYTRNPGFSKKFLPPPMLGDATKQVSIRFHHPLYKPNLTRNAHIGPRLQLTCDHGGRTQRPGPRPSIPRLGQHLQVAQLIQALYLAAPALISVFVQS